MGNPYGVTDGRREHPAVHLVKVFLDDGGRRLTCLFRHTDKAVTVEDALRLACASAAHERHIFEIADGLTEKPGEQRLDCDGAVLHKLI